MQAGNMEGVMAWYAKLDGVDGSAKDGTSNTLMLAEMDSWKFMPATEDEVLVAFEFGDKDHDVDGRDFLVWQRNPGHPLGDDDLSLQGPLGELDATVPRINKPSLTVKFDIGGVPGSLEDDLDLAWSAPASAGPNAGAYGFFLTKQPLPVDSNADWDALGHLIAMGEDAEKPSLIVKFDIGGPAGSVLE
jgi:hypothetical protein